MTHTKTQAVCKCDPVNTGAWGMLAPVREKEQPGNVV